MPANTVNPATPTSVTISVAGESVTLLPHRAAVWRGTLLVADLHLGKAETLHTLGVGAPGALMDESLDRLAAAMRDSCANRLLILGDLLHAPAGLTESMIGRVGEWRERINAEIVVVPGNHDRKLESLATAWRFTVAPQRLDEGPFTFTHDPVRISGRYVWGGHLHPALKIPGGRMPLKLPCFHLGTEVGVLPAFSAFTAGGSLRRAPGDRVFAIADGRVIEA